jgi:hypothetical protein
MPGKFEGNSDPEMAEYLYERSMNGWQNEDKGESDYSGWHCLFIFDDEQLPTDIGNAEIVKRLGRAYVCTEDNFGFWTCQVFDSSEEARTYYEQLPDFGANDALLALSEEVEPTCDICGRGQYDSPNILPKMRQYEGDWDGETGNHLICEQNAGMKMVEKCGCTPNLSPIPFDLDGDGIGEQCRRCGEYISLVAEESTNG